MADLEELLIRVNSDVGDLGGIDKAIEALNGLKEFSDKATSGAQALSTLANAFRTLNREGRKKSGIDSIKSQVGSLISVLDVLATHTKDATATIKQLDSLGEALKKFAGMASSLEGLSEIAKGAKDMVGVLAALGGLGGTAQKAAKGINQIGGIGKGLNNAADNVNKGTAKLNNAIDNAEKGLNRNIEGNVNIDVNTKPIDTNAVKKEAADARKEINKAVASGLNNKNDIPVTLNNVSKGEENVIDNAEKMTRLLVVGSRSFKDYDQLAQTLDRIAEGYKKIEIVSGGAKGADSLARRYAKERGLDYKEFPAQWDKYGNSAGYKRNEEMHQYIAQFDDRKVVAFWDGVSKGTAHNFDLATKYNNELELIRVNIEKINNATNANVSNLSGDQKAEQLKTLYEKQRDIYADLLRLTEQKAKEDMPGLSAIIAYYDRMYGQLYAELDKVGSDIFKLGGTALPFHKGVFEDVESFNSYLKDANKLLGNFGREGSSGIDNTTSETNNLAHAMEGVASSAQNAVNSIKQLSGVANVIEQLANAGNRSKDFVEQAAFFNDKTGVISSTISSNEHGRVSGVELEKELEKFKGLVNTGMHSHPAEFAAFSSADLVTSFEKYIQDGITKELVVGMKEITSLDISKMIDPTKLIAIASDFQKNIGEKLGETMLMSISQIESVLLPKNTFTSVISENIVATLKERFSDVDFSNVLASINQVIKDYISNLSKSSAINPTTMTKDLAQVIGAKLQGLNIDSDALSHAVWTPISALFNESLKAVIGKENVELAFQSFAKKTLKDTFTAHGENADDVMKSFSVKDYTDQLRLGQIPEDLKETNAELDKLIEERKQLIERLGKILNDKRIVENNIQGSSDLYYIDQLDKEKDQIVGRLKEINTVITEAQTPVEIPWDDYSALDESNKRLRELIEEKESLINKLHALTKANKDVLDNVHLEGMYGNVDTSEAIEKEFADTQARLQEVLHQIEKINNAKTSMQSMVGFKSEEPFGDVATPLENMAEAVSMFDNIAQGIQNLTALGEALHSFNGLDDNLKSLSDVAAGLLAIGEAAQKLNGLTANDLGYIDVIKGKMDLLAQTCDKWFPIGEATTGVARLVEALDSTKEVDTGKLDAISAALKSLRNDDDFMDAARKIASALMGLGDAFESLNKSSRTININTSTISTGFDEAVNGLYNVREQIEIISQDFDSVLSPVLNSRLVELLETFRSMNDSYKNVSGIAQGLGVLLDALIRLKGQTLDTSPVDEILRKLDSISPDQITRIVENFGRLDSVTDSIARLLNAIKYFKFPLNSEQTVFGRLKQELENFNTGIEADFKETRSLLYGFKSVFEALQNGNDIPADNMFTKLTAAISKMINDLGWARDGLKDVSSFLYGMQEVMKLASSDKLPANTFGQVFDDLVGELNKVLQIEPDVYARFGGVARLLRGFAEVGNLLNTGVRFDKNNNFIADLGEALKSFATDTLQDAGKLTEVFKAFKSLAEASNTISSSAGSQRMVERLNTFAIAIAEISDYSDQLQGMEKAISALSRLFKVLTSAPKDMSVEDNPLKTVGLGIGSLVDNAQGLEEVVKPLNSVVKLVTAVTEGASKIKDTNALSRVVESLKGLQGVEFPQNLASLANGFTKLVDVVGKTKLDGRKNNAIDIIAKSAKKFESLATSLKGFNTILTSMRKVVETVVANDAKVGETNVLTIIADSLGRFKTLATDLKGLKSTFSAIESLIKLASSDIDFGKNNPLSQLKKILGGFSDINKGTKGLDKTVRSLINAIDLMKQVNGKDFQIDPVNNPFAVLRDQLDQFADATQNLKDFPTVIKALKDFMKQFDSTKGFSVTAQPIADILVAVKEAAGMGDAVVNFKAIIKAIKDISGKADGATLSAIGAGLKTISDNIAPFATTGKLQSLVDVANAMVKMKDIELDKFRAMADAIRDIMSALGQINGSNNTIKITLDERGIVNAEHDIQSIHRTWDEFVADVLTDVQTMQATHIFDVNGTTKEMRAELKKAEQALKSAQKEVAKWQESMRQTERVKTPEGAKDVENYRRAYANYWKAKKEADEYSKAVQALNDNLRIRNGYELENDAEGFRVRKSLTDEKKAIEQTLKEFRQKSSAMNVFGDQTQQATTVYFLERRLEVIDDSLEKINNEIRSMPKTLEGIKEKSAQIQEIWGEKMQKDTEAANESLGQIGDTLSKLGGGFKDIPLLNKSDTFKFLGDGVSKLGELVKGGKLGNLGLSPEALATLGKAAGIFGMVAGAVGILVTALKKLWDDLDKIRQLLLDFTKQVVNFARTLMSKVIGAFNAVAGAVSKVASVVRSGAEGIAVALRKIGEVGKGIASIFSKVANSFAPIAKGVKSILSLATPRIVRTLAESNKSLGEIIKKSKVIGKLMKTATRWFTMMTRMLMRRTITAFLRELKQAFEDLVVFEKNAGDSMLNLNTNVSKIFSGLRISANQWIAAFEPLINAVTPTVLNFLRNVQAMGENVAKFMAILTGQPYYIRAKQFYEDYGQNVEDTAKKVKDLTNGLDELNILNDSKDNDDGIKPEDMFEKVPVSGMFDGFSIDLDNIIDKIVDFLKNIDWEAIWAKLREFIHRIMEMINQILGRLDLWEWLGKTIANLFNTLMVAWNQFITDFDPVATEKALSTLIINALQGIDWDLIHENIELTAKKFAQFWNEVFADDALWNEIARTITNFLNEIVHYFNTWAWTFDFSQMAQQLTDTITKILNGFDWEQLRSAVEGWVTGLVNFVNTVIANKEFWKALGQTVEHIINDVLIEAFKNLAKIDLVGLSDSLKVAISNAIDEIKWEDFTESLRTLATKFAQALNNFFGDEEFLTKITTAIANFTNSILWAIDDFLTNLEAMDIATAITNAFKAGFEKVDWDTAFKLPAKAINALSSAIKGLFDSLPDGQTMADWLTSHLLMFVNEIDWDLIESNVEELGKKLSDFIDGILGNGEFWTTAGETTGRIIKIGVDFLFNLVNFKGEDLGTAITNYVNGLISKVNIGKLIKKTVDVAVNLLVALDVALTGINWDELADQITKGIIDAVNEIYANRALIKKTIEDAFGVVSNLINKVLVGMINDGSFAKIGTTIGEILTGALNGLAGFFNQNGGAIITAVKQLANSLAAYLKAHHAEIVASLNIIIDTLADIIRGFLDPMGELSEEIASIIEELHLSNLLSALFEAFIQKLIEKSEILGAIFDSLFDDGVIDGIVDILSDGIGRLIKKIAEKLFSAENLLKLLEFNFTITGLNFPAMLIRAIRKALFGDNNEKLKVEIDKDANGNDVDVDITGKENIWSRFLEKWQKVKNWFAEKAKGIGDFFANLFGKDNKIPVELEAEVDANATYNLEDVKDKVELQFEDASLGKITATTIEVKQFKGDMLTVDSMFAETLTLVDIFADALHVGVIDGELPSVLGARRDMSENLAGNDMTVQSGTLYKDPEINAIKINTPLLDAEKTITPLLSATLIESLKAAINQIESLQASIQSILSNKLSTGTITSSLLNAGTINGKLNLSLNNVDWSGYGRQIANAVNSSLKVPTVNVNYTGGGYTGGGYTGGGYTGYIGRTGGGRYSGRVGLPSAWDYLNGSTGTKNHTTATSSNSQQIWDSLYDLIGNPYGTAGLMGNLFAESGLNPSNLQDSYNNRFGMTDQQYVDWVNKNSAFKGGGFGLAQWTSDDRLQRLLDFANGGDISNLTTQLEYLKQELQKYYPEVLKELQNASSVLDASNAVLHDFEKPKDQSYDVEQLRNAFGEDFLKQFLEGTLGDSPAVLGARRDEDSGIRLDCPAPSDFQQALAKVDWNKVLKKLDWNKLLKNIDWNKLLQNVDLNKLIDKIDFDNLAKKFGKALVDKLDWKQIGEKLGKAIADALKKSEEDSPAVLGARRDKADELNNLAFNFPDDYLSKEDVLAIKVRLGNIWLDTKEMLDRVKALFKDFKFADIFLPNTEIEKIKDRLYRLYLNIQTFLNRLKELFADTSFLDGLFDGLADAFKESLDSLSDMANLEMAEVYDTIDQWLEGIYLLLERFKAPFSLGILDSLKAELAQAFNEIKAFVQQAQAELNKLHLNDISKGLSNLKIKCECNCGSGGKSVSINKDFWNKLDNLIGEHCVHLQKKIEAVTSAIKSLGSKISKIKCECTCCCNCNGCGSNTPTGNSPTGGTNTPTGGINTPTTNIQDEPTPTAPTPTSGTNTPTGGTHTPTGGTNTPTGGTNTPTGGYNPPTGTNNPTGGTNTPTGGNNGGGDDDDIGYTNASDFLKLVHNGVTYPLYVTIGKARMLVGRDMPLDIRKRLLAGEGTLDLGGIPLSKFKGISSSGYDVSQDSSWRAMMLKLWGADGTNDVVDHISGPNSGTNTPTGGNNPPTGTNTPTGGSNPPTTVGHGGEGYPTNETTPTTSTPSSDNQWVSAGHTDEGSAVPQDERHFPSSTSGTKNNGTKGEYLTNPIPYTDNQDVGQIPENSLGDRTNTGSDTSDGTKNRFQQWWDEERKRRHTSAQSALDNYNASQERVRQNQEKFEQRQQELQEQAERAKQELEERQRQQQENQENIDKSYQEKKKKAFTGDDEKTVKEANQKVDDLRKKAKEYYDYIKKNGSDEQKTKAENAYRELTTDRGYSIYVEGSDTKDKPYVVANVTGATVDEAVKNSWYQKKYDELFKLSEQLKAKKELGEGFEDLSIGINGGVVPVTSLSPETIATAVQSDRDRNGNEIYFYKKNTGANSATKGDKVTDQETIQKIRDYLKKRYSITDDSTNDLTGNQQEIYSLYRQVVQAGDEEATEKAKKYFNSYLAWQSSSSKENRATKQAYYKEQLQKLAGINSKDGATSDPRVQQAIDALNNDAWVTFGKSGAGVTGASQKGKPLTKLSLVNDILSGTQKLGVFNVGNIVKFEDEDADAVKMQAFNAWYQRFQTKGYQMGGMPNSGEIFVARENGAPEFVGSFGGKTAVANNDQIVTAVANGVSMAQDRVVNAIESQTSSLENAIDRKDLDVQIGDRQIAEANRRGEKSLGQNFIN